MKPFRLELAVFAIAAIFLSWNLWNVGIASGYIDPLLHFGAQDEATYTREAIVMARDGGWMTPEFLGRWVFEKPPLLMWLSAVSMKVFGIGRLQARLPAVLAGALICMLCFALVRRERSIGAGVAAAAMAMTSQILFTMSRHNMTDILLAASGLCALAFMLRSNDAGFVIAAAAGIMAKSIAGLLPLAVAGVFALLRRERIPWSKILAAIALASPWFVYNLILHREWFIADMGFQIITVGTAGHQTSPESHAAFYLRRLIDSDLKTILVLLIAVPAIWRALRAREQSAWLWTAYIAVYGAALLVFRFHSEQYLTWFVPALILLAATYSPILNGKWAWIVAGLILATPIGLSFRGGSTIAPAPVLSRYCGEHRAADLYVLGVDDEFYSAVLPLNRVRYGWVDASGSVAREHPHLAYLGILLPADGSGVTNETYAQRLRAWGLNSTLAIGTGYSAISNAELLRMIREHPESDFLVARAVLPSPESGTAHRVVFEGEDFSLLESKSSTGTIQAQWTCGM